MQTIARYSNGDARSALNLLELTTAASQAVRGGEGRRIDLALLQQAVQRRTLSAATRQAKSITTSSRRCTSRCATAIPTPRSTGSRAWSRPANPLYIARRLIRFASEDIGNADPQALTVAVAAKDAVHFIGMPEGNTALAQAVIYLATAPKSNAVYVAYNEAAEDALRQIAEPVPLHIRNAPTPLMKELKYGKGLPLRAQRGRGRGRHGLPAFAFAGQEALPADRSRLRAGDPQGLDAWKQARKQVK